jgi:hypothetical protein
MQLLGTDAFRNSLAEGLLDANNSVDVLSAYITVPGIEWLLSLLKSEVRLRVIARWNCSDLVSGASDARVYETLRTRGAEFFVLQDLHAKLVLIDRTSVFLGSANITSNGLKLVPGGNRELSVRFPATEEQTQIVESFIRNSTKMTDELYSAVLDEVSQHPSPNWARPQWSCGLNQALSPAPKYLWVSELIWSPSPTYLLDHPDDARSRHDLMMLGLVASDSLKVVMREAFLASRSWRWLIETLRGSENSTLYFGALSQRLHASLIDDPAPYRQEVKGLLSNLLAFAEVFGEQSLLIDRPSHSQRVRLIS